MPVHHTKETLAELKLPRAVRLPPIMAELVVILPASAAKVTHVGGVIVVAVIIKV